MPNSLAGKITPKTNAIDTYINPNVRHLDLHIHHIHSSQERQLKFKSLAFCAIFLISCSQELEPTNESTPIGGWARHNNFLEAGFVDSSTVEYSLIIGADSVGLWRMYINDSIKKAVKGRWVLSHDTLTVRYQICSRFENMTPIDCSELPILGDLKFRWYGDRIWELEPSGIPYDRK